MRCRRLPWPGKDGLQWGYCHFGCLFQLECVFRYLFTELLASRLRRNSTTSLRSFGRDKKKG